eukprot:6592577-Lingulodinium_polyedra.AAC.1
MPACFADFVSVGWVRVLERIPSPGPVSRCEGGHARFSSGSLSGGRVGVVRGAGVVDGARSGLPGRPAAA